MKRVRRSAIAVALIVALSAFVSVASASAAWFVPQETTTTFLQGTPTTSHVFNLGGTISCVAPAVEKSISGPVQTIGATASPSYYDCNYFGTHKLNMNGCSLTFGAGGTVDIGPANCGPMSMVYTPGCSVLVYPKTGLSTTYTNNGEGEKAGVLISVSGSGLKYSDTCEPSHSGENGTYTGKWQLNGYSNSVHTIQKGISVAATAPNGLFLSSGKFAAEAYPATVSTALTQTAKFKLGAWSEAVCKAGQWSSYYQLTAPVTQLWDRGGTLSQCTLSNLTATVYTNTCDAIEFDAATGATKIVCETEGDAIMFQAKSGGQLVCTAYLPEQVIGTATYSTTGEGFQKRITATVSGTGIQYYSEEPYEEVCAIGSGSNGTFSGTFQLTGARP